MLQAGILEEQNPRPSLTRSSCQLGKGLHTKMIRSCSGTGPTLTRPCSTQPPKTKGKRTCSSQMRLCTWVVLFVLILPPSLPLFPPTILKNPSFGLTAIPHSPSPLPVPVLPLFPTFRAVITLEPETFDQPEQEFFIELPSCFYCASTTLLYLQPAVPHVKSQQSAQKQQKGPCLSITPSFSRVASRSWAFTS